MLKVYWDKLKIMQQILDLHIHSRYSRACSPQLTLENIDAACRTKGVNVIATGDFTYPAWFESINKELKVLRGKGYLTTSWNTIVINDLEPLRRRMP